MKLDDHDVVRATRQLSDNVPAGKRGTIVQVFESPRLAYMVEFTKGIETSDLALKNHLDAQAKKQKAERAQKKQTQPPKK